jgi:hypothetical protein
MLNGMQLLTFILNLPWSLALLVASIFSFPTRVKFHRSPLAVVVYVRSFWYYRWVPSQKGVRAMTLGNVILLGPRLLKNDLEHELVHIKQHQREPFIHPILNQIETFRRGYRKNKYEDEAYTTTNSTYIGHQLK